MIIRDAGPILHLGKCQHGAWADWLYHIRHLTRCQRGLCSQGRTLYFDSLAVFKRKRGLWNRDGARLLVKVPLSGVCASSAYLESVGFKNVMTLSGAVLPVASVLTVSSGSTFPDGWRCDETNGFTASALLKIYQHSQRQCDLTPVPLWMLKDCREGRTLILRGPEGDIAGGAALVFYRTTAGARDFLLYGVFVIAAYRGRRFGELLVSHLLGLPEIAKTRMGFIILQSDGVIDFYARFGFMVADRFAFLYCDGFSSRVK